MPRVRSEDWVPSGVEELEPNAWEALKSENNTCVVAGPGAGKTEFLAQRATYLLQTGICPPPFRILAISFKKDAAKNIAERVRKRCPADQAQRFISLTFDAFTKGLVDRFAGSLPEEWRLEQPYEIIFPKSRDYGDFLDRTRMSAPRELQAEIMAINQNLFESREVGSMKLPIDGMEERSGKEFAVARWWLQNLGHPGGSLLSFIMINRLAELLMRSRPQILSAIRKTYPFVFVDEFQDTTFAQYDLLSTAFHGSASMITAVGDDKQRIMLWAGARNDAFRRFERDFEATRIPLLSNFRSSEDLVKIQHVVARALDEGVEEARAQVACTIDGDVAQIWTFDTADQEAEKIGAWLNEDMANRGTEPRDYAIIVRQTADRFEEGLSPSLERHGLSLRNENRFVGDMALQDLLAEELTHVFISLLKLATRERAPAAWRLASDTHQGLSGVDPDDELGGHKAERELSAFIRELANRLKHEPPDDNTAQAVSESIFEFLDLEAVSRTYQQYNIGDLLAITVASIQQHISSCAETAGNWNACINAFEGVNSVPLMTIHKSKGLEFDTVLFVGLDDGTWWSHSPDNPEGVATFFVALSRAKQRAVFTYCATRGGKEGVADLYELLSEAGVPEFHIGTEGQCSMVHGIDLPP